jgi:hypothetical protein
MKELQAVVRARRDGGSLSNTVLRKLGLPEDSYNFQGGEVGLLRMAVPLRKTQVQNGLVVPMVRWDNDPRGYYVSVDDCQLNTQIVGVQDTENRRFLLPE